MPTAQEPVRDPASKAGPVTGLTSDHLGHAVADSDVALRPVTPLALIAAALSNLCERAADDAAGSSQLLEPLLRVHRLAAGLDPYLRSSTSPESEALRDLTLRTNAQTWGGVIQEATATSLDSRTPLEAEMLSGHVEGKLLQILIRALRATTALDIGMFTGYSSLAMAEALPEGGRVTACEIDVRTATMASAAFAESEHGDKITVHVGPALDTLLELARAGASFDFVFLDADKPGYEDYFTAIMDGGLLDPHGLMCVDNTLMQGEAYLPEPTRNGAAIHAFNRAVAADPRVQQVLLPLRDGITIIQRVDDSVDQPATGHLGQSVPTTAKPGGTRARITH
jgi:caffeoyl-CoA O-methyltransferase